ncbi:MAG: hypothetical protein ABFC77_03455 [Thermoguttaceae bacterium]
MSSLEQGTTGGNLPQDRSYGLPPCADVLQAGGTLVPPLPTTGISKDIPGVRVNQNSEVETNLPYFTDFL